MVQSQLSAYSGSDPVWGFVALVGSEQFTGEAAVGLDPRVRLFAVEGRIYFAEREDDAPVGTRLVNCGAITANQLARGAVHAGGNESLARLFQRDATIDRDAVELTIEAATESLLASIAHNPVGMPEVFPLRYHSAGLHHWLRGATATEPPAVESVVGEPPVVEPPVVEPPVVEPPAVEPVAVEPPVVEPVVVEPVVVEPVIAEAEPVLEVAAETPALPLLRTSLVTDAYPAPKLPEPTIPESPRLDDEPIWAVPADARELTALVPPPQLVEIPAAELSPAPIAATLPGSTSAPELPKLASLTSVQVPTAATNPFEPAAPAATDPALPKLAAGPISVKDLKQDLTNEAAASEPWTSSSKSMAAVQIWEMVDVMFDDGKKQDPRAGHNAPAARSRGWLRKKG